MPERSDISLRGLAAGAALILGGVAASLAAAALVASRVPEPAASPSSGPPPEMAGARLQTAAPEDLAAYLREKNARLHSRGPIEGDTAHVHIPIEQAMQILASRQGK